MRYVIDSHHHYDHIAGVRQQRQAAAWVRIDAAVYARINETWRAQLNVENLFDAGYWSTAGGNNNLSPGRTRTVRLTATANF